MKIRIDNVAHYKKVVTSICSIPSVRKQLSGIEQCIELKTNKEEKVLEISTVDMNSHAIKLKVEAEILEEGRQIVLSNKMKAMSSKLNPKLGLVIHNENNLLNYEMKPYGSIVDTQYFSQESELSEALFEETKYTDVTPDLGLFLNLIPIACSNTYNDREVYMTTNPNEIRLYVQFGETSYIRYKSETATLATVTDFRAAIRPALLKIVQLLGEQVELKYSSELKSVMFSSEVGDIALVIDNSKNKIALKMDKIIGEEANGEVDVPHDDFVQSINWQSYNSNETTIVDLDFNPSDSHFTIQVGNQELNKPSSLEVSYSGLFSNTKLSVGHLTKALKAMGSPKNKIIPVETVKILLKSVPVIKSVPIKAIHLKPELEDTITSDVVMYEASCK